MCLVNRNPLRRLLIGSNGLFVRSRLDSERPALADIRYRRRVPMLLELLESLLQA